MTGESLEVALGQDPAGFVRRECPRCLRAFKTRPAHADAAVLQRRLAQLVPLENAHEGARAVAEARCPYCGHRAAADDFLTALQAEHLEALAHALHEHLRYEQLRHVERTLSVNPHPTFVTVRPAALPREMPPDDDDLRAVALVCCGEEVKLEPDWHEPLFCPRCGAEHGTGGHARPRSA